MGKLLFSIITPVFNGSEHLGETIQSVLRQTYPNFEHFLVDDASPDNSSEVIHNFRDSRITYLRHEHNQGADAARNNAIRAATGQIIVFLDQDDIFHPEKLQAHLEFLEMHPDVGFTYNGRYEFVNSLTDIRNIWMPPKQIGLGELITSTHLLSPSEMVIRREWIEQVGLWDDTQYVGNEMVLLGRLLLEGCKFAGLERVLNYRRFYQNRKFGNLEKLCKEEMAARQLVFSDPRCPPVVLEMRNASFANNYLAFANFAFAQNETALGRQFVTHALELNPGFVEGDPPQLLKSFALNSLIDDSFPHESIIGQIFEQLPENLKNLDEYRDWAVAHRYFIFGVKDLILGKPAQGKSQILKGLAYGLCLTPAHLGFITQLMIDHWIAVGPQNTTLLIAEICDILAENGEKQFASRLKAEIALNFAFKYFERSEYDRVLGEIMKAVWNQPRFLVNRGAISLFLRSLVNTLGVNWR